MTSLRINARKITRLRTLTPWVTVVWLLGITGVAIRTSQQQLAQLMALAHDIPERGHALAFAFGTVSIAVLLTTLVGLFRPAWWYRAILILATLPTMIMVGTSRNFLAALAAIGILFPILWCGKELAAYALNLVDTIDSWIIGAAIGLGLLAFLGYGFGKIGWLRPQYLWPTLIALTAILLMTAIRRLRDNVRIARSHLWRPLEQRGARIPLVGLLIGFFWLNAIGALAPEIMADAVRQRLAAAAFFAKVGRLAVDPELNVTTAPHIGEVLYAVVLACGPLQTAKVINLTVGMLCAAGVWNLGRHLGGRRAALIALVMFYTLPLTTWLSQTAYIDLFATFFAIAAALLIVVRKQLNRRLFVAVFLCIGLGLGVKTSFIPIAIGLTAATLMYALYDRLPSRVLAWVGIMLLSTGMAFLIMQNFGIFPSPPLVSILKRFQPIIGTRVEVFTELSEFGVGHSLSALARLPLDLTLQSNLFGENQAGFIGFLALALLPFPFIIHFTKRSLAILSGTALALIIWFMVAQYLRYLMPVLALSCGIGGAAVVAVEKSEGVANRTILNRLLGIIFVMLTMPSLVGYLNTVLVYPGDIPYRVVFGLQDRQQYLSEHIPAYNVLRLLEQEREATRVLTSYELARLYSGARLTNVLFSVPPTVGAADPEAALLQYLDQGGYSHIIVDRNLLPPNWESILAINEDFLRRNTILVGGAHNAYLYRLVPPDQRGYNHDWAQGKELLTNGSFEQLRDNHPLGWSAIGQPIYDTSGMSSHVGRTAIHLTPQDTLVTTVDVTPNREYLLTHATRGDTESGLARLQINWLDMAGHTLAVAIEVVPATTRTYSVHSMLATAPPEASKAMIYAQPQQGGIWFDDFSLRSRGPESEEVEGPELLVDPGFESLGVHAGPWQPYGEQSSQRYGVQPSPLTAGSAVYASPNSGYTQKVPIAQGREYTLRYTAWSPQAAWGRLQINWSDINGAFISSSISVVEIAERPEPYSKSATAPAGAAFADVYVSVQEKGPIWFDDYSFREKLAR